MDAECDIIRVKTNQLFLDIIENSRAAKELIAAEPQASKILLDALNIHCAYNLLYYICFIVFSEKFRFLLDE